MISVVERSSGSLLDRGTMEICMVECVVWIVLWSHGTIQTHALPKALTGLVTVLPMDEKSVWKDLE